MKPPTALYISKRKPDKILNLQCISLPSRFVKIPMVWHHIFKSKSKPENMSENNMLNFSSFRPTKPVVPGGAGDALAPLDFDRSINPISIKRGILCPPNNTGTLGFSDLPTALSHI